MTAFNVVRFRVKRGAEQAFLDAHHQANRNWPGSRRFNVVDAGDGRFFVIGEWDSIEAMAAEAQTRLAEAEAQAATLKAEAEETARKALARAAIGRLQAALESGAPFASALADLPDAPIPPALAAAAESGVPSLAALEQAFPPAARAALDASRRADMGESWTERLGAFLS